MRDRRYWLRLLRLFVVAVVAALVLLPVGFGAAMMWGITHSGCARSGDPSAYSLIYEDIQLTTPQGLTLPAFFIPGTNGATVIVVPAFTNDRGGDLLDASVLNQAGFNVLTFDNRRCDGAPFHSLGLLEADDAEAAFRYLTTRPDVDANRISIHGFSSAGSTSLFTAARVPELRAVSAKGGYHDMAEQLGLGRDGSAFDVLFRVGTVVSYRLITGQDVRALSPLTAVDSIVPRPIFLIYGSRETSLAGAQIMLERAQALGGNAELWIVEGAGHGDYAQVAGDEYVRRLVEFHQRALLDRPT